MSKGVARDGKQKGEAAKYRGPSESLVEVRGEAEKMSEQSRRGDKWTPGGRTPHRLSGIQQNEATERGDPRPCRRGERQKLSILLALVEQVRNRGKS